MNYADPVTEEHAFAPYLGEILAVAERGHKDVSTENLLLALIELYRSHPAMMEEFITVFLQRAVKDGLEVTPRAFRLSLSTAVKLHLRTLGIKDYALFSIQSWKQVVLDCLQEGDEEFMRCCLRDVSTVKIYRYIALQLIGGVLTRSATLPPGGLNVLDGGCSINIGLKCLNDPERFQRIEVEAQISRLFHEELPHFPLQYALGIDKYPPSLERTLASLFPSEVTYWEDIYSKLFSMKKERVHYRRQDILYLDCQPEFQGKFDVVFLSSLLRRFPPHQISRMLSQVNYAMTPKSLLVINEQMSEDSIEGSGNYVTCIIAKNLLEHLVAQKSSSIDLYVLLSRAFQLFVYPDENCRKVSAGKDFQTFLTEYTHFRS
ncbi:hypothetical protein CSB45_09180 [candidate division KSB3 bacterium]|uniref:Uncharacterized protein n=1 Tax=candidate division KSB3 bacterium TaxID=2044937 RepID=A0A2G6E5L3_9BACT|nr:MAG: hypothetical protein CSB45_09180 [candidate division KSB3 bacterium]PIE29615.1 MAG: hypothetical protein CSA57_07250 [candidate division KSB3 bacterium]